MKVKIVKIKIQYPINRYFENSSQKILSFKNDKKRLRMF